jgi:hypothetical protein
MMIRARADEAAAESAVIGDLALDHGGALERIEPKSLSPNRHEALRRRAAGAFCRHDWPYPATLQALPSQNPTGLQMLAQVRLAATDDRNQEQTTDRPPNWPTNLV